MGDRLKDKIAIVTGAGSVGSGWGNGKAAAVLFAREGAKVLAVDINPTAAEETRRIILGGGRGVRHPPDRRFPGRTGESHGGSLPGGLWQDRCPSQ